MPRLRHHQGCFQGGNSPKLRDKLYPDGTPLSPLAPPSIAVTPPKENGPARTTTTRPGRDCSFGSLGVRWLRAKGARSYHGGMKDHEIEAWALRVIDDVKNGKLSEDSRVEVKSGWLSANNAARRIAGHCNAARGEYVLWLIGVDERKKAVVGAAENELSNWWAQVQSKFDGVPPTMTDLLVPSGDKTVCALLFETSRRPFVVKTRKADLAKLEVPWREGTAVRSAGREDLMRVLSPLEHQPDFELLHAELNAVHKFPHKPAKHYLSWALRLYGYLYVKPGSSFVIPFHKCEGVLKVESYPRPVGLAKVRVTPAESESWSIAGSLEQAVVEGPGGLIVSGEAEDRWKEVTIADRIQVEVILRSREIEHPITINATVRGKQEELGEHRIGTWYLDP